MKLQTFNNKKGLIYGNDPKRIGCDIEGVIKIGSAEIKVSPGADSVMPLLFYGADGDFRGSFVSGSGEEYDLGKIAVRGGIVDMKYNMDDVRMTEEAVKAYIEELPC